MRKFILIFVSALMFAACAPELETVVPDAPAVPEGLTEVPCGDVSSMRFEWQAADGATEYSYILRDRLGNVIDAGKTAGLYAEFTSLNTGYSYSFAVKAVNGGAESDFCAPVEGICGGEPRDPYGTLALDLYSLDGDIQIDTMTIIVKDASEQDITTGFKNVSLGQTPEKFYVKYLTEGDYTDIRYEIKYTRTSGENVLEEEYVMDVTTVMSVLCDTIVTCSAPVLALDRNDLYSVWLHGEDITIAGQVVNRASYPKAQLKTMSDISWDFLGSALDHPENGGVLFIENSERAYKATAASRTIGKDRIIIGRYRNEHQPIFKINGTGTYVWTLDGKVMMKNINLCSYQTSRCLFLGKSGAAHGASEFYFEDCTLTNTNTSYGIFIELNASCAVPKSMRFDNCILRANAAFFGASGRKNNAAATEENAYFASMQNLKSLTFNDCVFAPATLASGQTDVFADAVTRLAVKGVLVALYHNNYRFDDLDISFSHCSSYDLAPSTGAVGMVDVTSVRNLNFDHCMFYNSGTIANMWLSNTVLKCIGATYTVSATYSNKIGSNMLKYGPKSNFTADGGTVSASITEQNDLFGTCEPAKHYFPKSETFTNQAGASYDTKYWIVPSIQAPDEPTEIPQS